MKILSGLAEGQVLQRLGSRGASVKISGTCADAGAVTVTIGTKKGGLKGWKNREVGRAARGRFRVELAGIPAGGPYKLEARCGKGAARVREFFVGDVWVLAGQSNMQGVGNMGDAPKPHPLIRSLTMRREWMRAAEPLHLLGESPDFCHNGGLQSTGEESKRLRRTLSKGVGPGLWFALEMLKRTGIPQGLICTAHGGTSMTQWTPERMIEGKTSLYGSMMNSVEITGQPVAGVAWYQGESDANPKDVLVYTERMRKLVGAMRREMRQPGLPWMIVQIARVFGPRTAPEEKAWNALQEEQRLLPRSIKNLGVVAAIDLSMDDDIHISGKGQAQVGARLAREASRLAHGNRKEKQPPRLKSISSLRLARNVPQFTSHVVEVAFADVVGGLHAEGAPSGFAIVDGTGNDLRAIYKTTLHGDTARLHVRATNPADASLYYGFGTTPICNITDGRGHAIPVFGAQAMGKPQAWLPFVKTWKVTLPIEGARPLDKMAPPDMDAFGAETRTYGKNEFNLDGFINERPRWAGHHGQAYFAAKLELPEAMRLEFHMGYDGPFRLWIDGKPFFIDMNGVNPCFPDEIAKVTRLSAGMHVIHVGMDLNHGQAWGFFLRFVRKDVSAAAIESGDYARPSYGA